jgi:hypothetical protein
MPFEKPRELTVLEQAGNVKYRYPSTFPHGSPDLSRFVPYGAFRGQIALEANQPRRGLNRYCGYFYP